MKLSIVIPTKDRSAMLLETLATVIPQLREEVELLILDSSVAYPDQGVTRLLTPQVRYERAATEGFDAAYNEAVHAARGEWVWLFSDDDWFKPGAVAVVLPYLKVGLDLMIVNAEVRDRRMDRLLKARWVDLPCRNYSVDDYDRAFAETADLGTFLGSTLIRRQVWIDRIPEAQRYFGTRFLTFVIPFLRPTPMRFLNDVLVSARFGHQGWIRTCAQLIGETLVDVVWSLPLADWAKATVRPRRPPVPELLLWRSVGSDVSKHSQLIARLPRSVARIAVKAGLQLTGRAGGISDYMLSLTEAQES